MGRFIAVRLLQAVPVILAVITVTFFLVRVAPGGPFDSEKAVIPEVRAALEAQYRLDQPLLSSTSPTSATSRRVTSARPSSTRAAASTN
jgi:ABC-type dipeptide/oligopeptide/nickel transport system permease component